ncbi:MAG: hypothetical protein ACI85O_001635 [Saprospiraceae bacterium]|jgi:hypothetical protein
MKYETKKIPKDWGWIILAVITVLFRIILPASVIESVYSRGIFQFIRIVIDNTVGLLTFPTLYLFVAGLLFLLVRSIRNGIRFEGSFKQRLGRLGWSFLKFTSIVVFLFLSMWGFNYGRVPIEKQLSFDPKPLEYKELKKEFELTTQELIEMRKQISSATDSVLSPDLFPRDAERLIRADLEKWLARYDFPVRGRVRGRLLRPKGILLSISTAGVYLPWVGEGHIDAGMYEIQFPFVIAHEMSHGYGFTDEGTCNFIAYQAMRESDNPFFRYSAVLGYWVYLANAVARYDFDAYKEFYKTLPLGIRNDRQVIRAYSDSYPDFMPYFRDAFYNQYLKTQGIEEGMKNYSRVVMLAAAWRGMEPQE